MAYSHFQNGFSNGVTIRGLPLQQVQPGQVFYVNNSTVLASGAIAGSNGNKGSYQQPFSTLTYALSQCVAGRCDTIFIMPNHAEAISNSTALNLNKSGVAIIGLGSGNLLPTFTLNTAISATINVTAACITIVNCIFTSNFADITSCFTLTTAKNFCLDGCKIKATATNMNFLNVIDTNTTSFDTDGLTVINCSWVEPDLATLSFVKMDGSNINVVIDNNDINVGVNNNIATIMAIATSKTVTGSTRITGNRVYRLNTDTATGGLLVTTDVTTNSGVISMNLCQHADVIGEILVTASAGFAVFDNKSSGVVGASGYLLPVADS